MLRVISTNFGDCRSGREGGEDTFNHPWRAMVRGAWGMQVLEVVLVHRTKNNTGADQN